jgi:hypothetical protein
MRGYNGHRSWNAWNVALWIGNDESTYNFAMECITQPVKRSGKLLKPTIRIAVKRFIDGMGVGSKTPDGAEYNSLSVRLALEGMMNE